MKVNLYDFDKTIYDGDSSVNFYKYCLKKNPLIFTYLIKFTIYYSLYKLNLNTKEKAKENLFKFVTKFNNIDNIVEDFWNININKIKDFYKDKDHSNDIIISASPEFLLKPICNKLQVKDLIASPINKNTGLYHGKNCHGEEKVRRLKDKYNNIEVLEAYSDNLSDIPMLSLANTSYLVKKKRIIKYKNIGKD